MCDKSKLVGRILAAENSPFIKEDSERLSEMEESQLTRLAVGLEGSDPGDEDDEKEEVEEEVEKEPTPEPVALSAEKWLESAPADVRAMVDSYKKMDADRRGQLVAALSAKQKVRSAEQLNAMKTEDLVDLVAMLGIDKQVNYDGVAMPVAAASAVAEVPDAYAEAIKARRAAMKLA